MTILGLIDGLGEALVSISQAVSGYISDRIRRRKIFIWVGYLFGVVSRIGYAFSFVWQMLIPFKILDRAGKMRGAPRDAILADVSTNQNRGGNFGFLRMMDNLGAVVGIVISISLLGVLGFRNIFLLAAIPSIVAALLIFIFIKERKLPEKHLYKGISFRDLNNDLRLFIYLSAIFALGSFSYSFLLIYAQRSGFELYFVPFLYLIFTLAASIFSFPFGKLSDLIGRKKVMIIAFILWGLVCLSFIFLQTYWSVVLTFILYGMHRGALDTVQKVFVAELAVEKFRASTLGGFQMVVGLCALPASFIAGILWDGINIYAPFYLSLGLTVIAILLLLFVKENKPC